MKETTSRETLIDDLRTFVAEVREGAYAGYEGTPRLTLGLTLAVDVFEAEELAEMLEGKA